MAVTAALPGLKVTIRVGGKDLEEWEPVLQTEVETPPNQIIRYIESTTDAEFEIQLHIGEEYPFPNQGIKVRHYVDGVKVRTWTLAFKTLCGINWKATCVRQYDFDSEEWIEKRFTFKDISIVEEAGQATCDDKDTIEQLGTIEVVITRFKLERFSKIDSNDGNKPGDNYTLVGADLERMKKVLETKLKALPKSSHAVLGDAIPLRNAKTSSRVPQGKELDTEEAPFAKFTFKYRSINDLRLLDIISCPLRPLSPISLVDENNIDKSTMKSNDKMNDQTQMISAGKRIAYTDDEVQFISIAPKRQRTTVEVIQE